MPDIEKSTKIKKDDEESLKQELSKIIDDFLKTKN